MGQSWPWAIVREVLYVWNMLGKDEKQFFERVLNTRC